jgi:transcription elongation factor Elf1
MINYDNGYCPKCNAKYCGTTEGRYKREFNAVECQKCGHVFTATIAVLIDPWGGSHAVAASQVGPPVENQV